MTKNKIFSNLITVLILDLLLSQSSYTQDELSADKIFEKVDNSVVVIIAYDKEGNMFQGSGVVIDNKGTVITNQHVCAGADKIEIKHYSKEIKSVTVIKSDE